MMGLGLSSNPEADAEKAPIAEAEEPAAAAENKPAEAPPKRDVAKDKSRKRDLDRLRAERDEYKELFEVVRENLRTIKPRLAASTAAHDGAKAWLDYMEQHDADVGCLCMHCVKTAEAADEVSALVVSGLAAAKDGLLAVIHDDE